MCLSMHETRNNTHVQILPWLTLVRVHQEQTPGDTLELQLHPATACSSWAANALCQQLPR